MLRRRPDQSKDVPTSSVQGTARLDRRTKRLIGRIQPGEIAVIDHNDLDRIAAEGLVERKVKAVLNASRSSTGNYPNLGPLLLTSANIILIDDVGQEIFEELRDGDYVHLRGGDIFRKDELVGSGKFVDPQTAQEWLDEAKRDISKELERFAENTLEHIRLDRDLLLEGVKLPETRLDFHGRHVLVVVRGYGYKEDLDSLRRGYVRDFKPILVGVDGGADALLDVGLEPDVIIGDMDSVSTKALGSGAELVLHAYADGAAPGQDRLDALGLPYVTFDAPGTSEDIALLLSHEKGAELIVVVGARASLIEFMDKGRKGMASTFLVRLRVGPKLVDAKGVSELHRVGPTRWQLTGLVLAALVTMIIIVEVTPSLRIGVDAVRLMLQNLWFNIQQLVS